ncbi:MAG: hypothetical protein ACJ79P_15840 [Myxococcales bacterium]
MTPRAQVESFLRDAPRLFAAVPDEDDGGVQLLETGTGKALRLRWEDLLEAVLRRNPLRPAPYLVLVFHDGRQVALADVGFAFAPSIASTGPLPDLPGTFCFRDFRHLSQAVDGLLEEEGREKEALSALLLAIALLDGARVVGFEVGREERALEGLLRKLEERGLSVSPK